MPGTHRTFVRSAADCFERCARHQSTSMQRSRRYTSLSLCKNRSARSFIRLRCMSGHRKVREPPERFSGGICVLLVVAGFSPRLEIGRMHAEGVKGTYPVVCARVFARIPPETRTHRKSEACEDSSHSFGVPEVYPFLRACKRVRNFDECVM